MDMGEEDKFGLEKRSENTLNCHPPNMNTDWQFGSSNHTNDNSVAVGKGDLIMGSSTCSSVSMVDSFSPNLWGHPSSQNLNLCDSNVPKGIPNSFGTNIDNLGWNPTNSVPKTSIFSPSGVGMLPDSLSHFPADSGFIERAARFSCFNNRSFSDMVNPFNISESLNLHSKNGGSVHGSSAFHFDGLNPITSSHSPMNELCTTVVAKAVSVDRGSVDGSPLKSNIKAGNVPRTPDESKIESDGAEFSGGAGGLHEPSSSKGLSMKKRKRGGQVHDSKLDQGKEAANDNVDPKQKDDQAPSSTGKANKHGKDSTEAQDPPKQDYIHVRARRGQATNSHSLAERVRREKISERMKYLQDLVPGCSKVTGKAVMLDEIINYVQSLQRQVEFLSMKLATVNPRIDLNIEGLLAKDILQSRLGPSSMGFSPDMDMGHPQFNPLQPGLFREGVPGIANASDELRRTINSQLMAMNAGYKEPNSQIPHVWDDELNRVIQMNFEAGVPLNGQESSGPSTPGHMKVEH